MSCSMLAFVSGLAKAATLFSTVLVLSAHHILLRVNYFCPYVYYIEYRKSITFISHKRQVAEVTNVIYLHLSPRLEALRLIFRADWLILTADRLISVPNRLISALNWLILAANRLIPATNWLILAADRLIPATNIRIRLAYADACTQPDIHVPRAKTYLCFLILISFTAFSWHFG